MKLVNVVMFTICAVLILGITGCSNSTTTSSNITSTTSTTSMTTTTTSTKLKTTTTRTPITQIVVEPEPVQFSGKGDGLSPDFTLQQGVATFTISYEGESDLAIKLVDETGEDAGLLVNTPGPFQGTTSIEVNQENPTGIKPGKYIVEVTAEGVWTIVIRQPVANSLNMLPVTVSGKGYGVSYFFILPEELTSVVMTHDGVSNFTVQLFSADGRVSNVLLKTTGAYNGNKSLVVQSDNATGLVPGVYMLSIEADGNWTVSVSKQ
jgi:hypothetical protein